MRTLRSRRSNGMSPLKWTPRQGKHSLAPFLRRNGFSSTFTPEDARMTRTITYTEAIVEALAEELERDPTVFYMGEDVGFGGVFGLTRGLQARFGKIRVFDTPISETLIAGAGVGAAITGTRPIVELQFADFVTVAMDEIYNKAAKWRYMHGGFFKVPLVILAPEGAIGGAGPEHSQCPEALFWSAPGLYVLKPSTPADMKGMLKSAIRDDNPVLILPHKAHEAALRLSSEGIEIEIIDPRGVRPFDFETVIASVRKTGRLLLAHEAPVVGGAGGEVAAVIAERALTYLE